MPKTRVAMVTAATCAMMLVTAPAAYANWTSSIGSAGRGFESRRWNDQSYSQIWFKNCWVQNSTQRTEVAIWEDNFASPDKKYDTKTFTNCFKGTSYSSMGEWHGLSNDNFYFRLEDVGTDGHGLLWVDKVTVDTSAADQ